MLIRYLIIEKKIEDKIITYRKEDYRMKIRRILMTLRNYFCMRKNPSSGSHYHSINIWMLINGIACLVHKNINDMTLKLFLDGIINQRIEMCLVLGLSNLRSSEFSFPRLSSREVLALLSWEKKSLARGCWRWIIHIILLYARLFQNSKEIWLLPRRRSQR